MFIHCSIVKHFWRNREKGLDRSAESRVPNLNLKKPRHCKKFLFNMMNNSSTYFYPQRNTQLEIYFQVLSFIFTQSGPGCLHVTHYIILYLIKIYYYLGAKPVKSHYDQNDMILRQCIFLSYTHEPQHLVSDTS